MHIFNVSLIFSHFILFLGKSYISTVYFVIKPYFIHSAPVYSTAYKAPYLPFPGISNISLVTESFLELMRHAVNGQVQANGTLVLPWIKFIKELLESDNSTLPTIVPHQTAPLPSLRTDLYCNSGYFPNGCTNLDEIGKMIGVPIANWFQVSRITTHQRIIAHILSVLYSQATYGITPPLVTFLHLTPLLNGTVASAKNVINPLVTIPSESPLWKTITNLTAIGFWDVFFKHIDITDEYRAERFHMKRQTRSAILCQLFNERLPICQNLTQPVITAHDIPITEKKITLSLDVDDKTGFRLEIEIEGFESSCRYAPSECQISGFPSNPEQFDGRYKFMGLDDLGYPLYQKTNVRFSRFQAIKSLWLFVVGFSGPIFPQGITAMIMPNQPTYIGTAFQSRIPFAINAGVPPACVKASSFPLCLSSTEKPAYLLGNLSDRLSQRGTLSDETELTGWLLARSSLSLCTVTQDRNNGLCEIPVTSLRAVSNTSTSGFYNKLLLTLVSPTQTFYFRQPILSITVPGSQGAFTLTNHHSQIISQLKPGLVTVRDSENTVDHFFITNGFASLTAPTGDSKCSTAYVSAVDMEKLTDISQTSAVEILATLKEKNCSTNKERVLNDLAKDMISTLVSVLDKNKTTNPEILKKYTQRLGGPETCEFFDVFSTEDWAVAMLPPDIDGLLLVYSITTLSSMRDQQRNSEYTEKINNNAALAEIHKSIWFMKQTVENACGTVALFHLFLNGNRSLLQSNGVLSDFGVRTEGINPLERAEVFKQTPTISTAHHSIENEGQSKLDSKEKELSDSCNVNEHFIAYKDYGDYIVELDGRKPQPLLHKKTCFVNETTVKSSNLFLRNALDLIQQHYMSLNPTDIRFTIIAVRSFS